MKISEIHYCRECRVSHHKSIRRLKDSFIERPDNFRDLSKIDMSILENYVAKNIIKKPAHFASLSRMATDIGNECKNGRRLTVSFMGGKKQVKDRITGAKKK